MEKDIKVIYDWTQDYCQVLVSNCEATETLINACDICPFSDRCYKNHNGFMDWLTEAELI